MHARQTFLSPVSPRALCAPLDFRDVALGLIPTLGRRPSLLELTLTDAHPSTPSPPSPLPSLLSHPTPSPFYSPIKMARGLQKVQSQQKNADALKKAQGGNSNLKTAQSSLKLVCPACKLPTANANNLKEHWDAKHVRRSEQPSVELERGHRRGGRSALERARAEADLCFALLRP